MIKRLKKVLLIVIICLISLIGVGGARALSNSFTNVNAGDLISYDGGPRLYYKTYSGGVAFCTTFYVQGVGTSCSLSSQWSTPAASGVAAIINKYNSAPSTRNYYYSELAINKFLYDYETKAAVNNVSMFGSMSDYYNAAVSAYNEAKKDFSISLNADKLTFSLSDNNYVSNEVTVSGSNNYNVTVSGISGVTYEKNGNRFYVKVPETSVIEGTTTTVNVTVSANKTINIAKQYQCGSGNQYLTVNGVDSINKASDKSISGQITKEKRVTKLKISKQDLTSKKELPGATLILKNSKDEEIDRWISTDSAHYFEGLEAGKYTLTEIIAPEGYNLSKETIEFYLEANNKVTEVVMYNSLIDKYKVKISKQDITTKKELPGSTLILKNSKGEEIDRWVSGNIPHYIELEKGEYTLIEIQAPSGYDLNYEVIKFTVGEKGEVETEVVMYNSKTPDTGDRNIIILVSMMIIGASGIGLSIYKLKHQK